MEIFLFSAFFAFVIIYLAVRLAIDPLIPKDREVDVSQQDQGLIKLRDMEVLNNDELEEIIQIFSDKSMENKDHQQLLKYSRVLDNLKEIGYFTDEEYMKRMAKLKNYYNDNN